MSYYGDGDPNRNEGGQFYNHTNATVAQQWMAGVNQSDSYAMAHLKTESHRRSMGQDPYTGVPLPPSVAAFAYYPSSSRAPVDASQLGEVFWAVCKAVVLWPFGIAIALGALAFVAMLAGERFDAPTLAARAAKGEFADYQPRLAELFPASALAEPISPERLLAEFRAFKPSKAADPKMLRSHALMGEAYRCAFQPGCREGVSKLDGVAGDNLLRVAAGLFAERAKAGDEAATRDMCLLSIAAGTSYRDMVAAKRLCAEASALNKNSKAGAQALARMDGSWSMRRALLYDQFARLRWRFENGLLF